MNSNHELELEALRSKWAQLHHDLRTAISHEVEGLEIMMSRDTPNLEMARIRVERIRKLLAKGDNKA